MKKHHINVGELISNVREEIQSYPDIRPQVLIDEAVAIALEDVDVKGCMAILIAGELPCGREVDRIVPCSNFISATYKESVRAAAWVMLTSKVKEGL